MDKRAAFSKLAESLMLTIRQDMEQHPDQYRDQQVPTHMELMQFLDQQNSDASQTDYQMKVAEALKRLRAGKSILND